MYPTSLLLHIHLRDSDHRTLFYSLICVLSCRRLFVLIIQPLSETIVTSDILSVTLRTFLEITDIQSPGGLAGITDAMITLNFYTESQLAECIIPYIQ